MPHPVSVPSRRKSSECFNLGRHTACWCRRRLPVPVDEGAAGAGAPGPRAAGRQGQGLDEPQHNGTPVRGVAGRVHPRLPRIVPPAVAVPARVPGARRRAHPPQEPVSTSLPQASERCRGSGTGGRLTRCRHGAADAHRKRPCVAHATATVGAVGAVAAAGRDGRARATAAATWVAVATGPVGPTYRRSCMRSEACTSSAYCAVYTPINQHRSCEMRDARFSHSRAARVKCSCGSESLVVAAVPGGAIHGLGHATCLG